MSRHGRTVHPRWAALAALACLLAPPTGAAEVYRSVDESGHVTFSDSPPADAVEVAPVEIEPGPSEAEVRAAHERLEAGREQLAAMKAAREAEREREREARLQRLEELALRNAARPAPPVVVLVEEPDPVPLLGFGRHGFPELGGHRGFRSPHHPRHREEGHDPPFRRAEPLPQRKVLESPLFDKRVSPIYR
ncbi:MAG: DUF4124 domain-containing protein [Gammaproteobacteria bacterium]|nr:DUF4124 domain-containing protein [Gammaproteobacteria bacterium]